MRKKIFIIEPVGGHGGMNYYNTGLGMGLASANADTTLYTCPETLDESTNNFTIKKNFKSVYGKKHKLLRATNYIIALTKSLFHIRASSGKFCHLHYFQYSLLELASCLIIKSFGINIIATVHDVEAFSSGSLNFYQKAIFKLTSEFIVHNKFSEKELRTILHRSKISPSINIIPHGNYLPFIQKKEKLESLTRLGIPENKKIILFFGQIKKVKGLDLLLHALPEVLKEEPNTLLLIAGKVWKDTFSEYESTIESLGINNSVMTHIKYIPDHLVDLYYSAADIVSLPYQRIYQSGVLLMAMSYGCITVSSRLEAMSEVIIDGENGYLFEPGDYNSLARTIVTSLRAPPEPIARAALATMLDHHDWLNIAKKHMAIYERYS